MIVFIAVADIAVCVIGNQVLDKATRDACRAAASQTNLADATNAANAALSIHKTSGFISQPTLKHIVFADNGGIPGGVIVGGVAQPNPTVTVSATLSVQLPTGSTTGPLNLSLKGQENISSKGEVTFARQYTFPIIRQNLNLNAF